MMANTSGSRSKLPVSLPSESLPNHTSETPGSRNLQDLYSPSQIQEYLKHIALHRKHLSSPIFNDPTLARTLEHGMPLLAALMKHHQAEIPYENLNVHCYPSPMATLDVHEVHKMIVGSGRGRGGPCFMMNGLLGNVLRTLGFEVLEVGARVNNACQPIAATPEYKGPRYNGWDHQLLLVVLSQQRYLIDVGMGPYGPIVVLPLRHCFTASSISPRQVRLLHGCIPENSSQGRLNKLWRLESRKDEESPWIPTYAFTEIEFFQRDYEVMSWYWYTNPLSWLTQTLIATRLILDDEGDELIGSVSLNELRLTRRRHGEIDFSTLYHSSAEMVELMRIHLGIGLTHEEEINLWKFITRINKSKI